MALVQARKLFLRMHGLTDIFLDYSASVRRMSRSELKVSRETAEGQDSCFDEKWTSHALNWRVNKSLSFEHADREVLLPMRKTV
jgi:hypothetical protein